MNPNRYDVTTPWLDDLHAPPRRASDIHYEPRRPDELVGAAEILAHLLMAAIIFFAMWRSAADVRNALVMAVIYFGTATTLRVLAKTDTLKDWLRAWLDYCLERERIHTVRALHEQRLALHAPRSDPAPALPNRSPITEWGQSPIAAESEPNYVAPYAPEDLALAVQWAESLFDEDGYADRHKLNADGRVRGTVIGSKRDKHGTAGAQQYLIDRRFLTLRANGGYVNLKRYPTRAHAHALRVHD